MIRNDSAYLKSFDINAIPTYKLNRKTKEQDIKYGGSMAFWMSKYKRALFDINNLTEKKYKELVFEIVSSDAEK